jgi:hypothetical protein
MSKNKSTKPQPKTEQSPEQESKEPKKKSMVQNIVDTVSEVFNGPKKEEATVEIGNAFELEVPFGSTDIVSSSATPVEEDSRLVKVLIKYPGDYPAKKKHFKDGDIKKVSPESAEAFVKAGFASLVE